MSKIDQLISERDKLSVELQTNHHDRIEIQHRLDELTTTIARLTGVGLMLGDMPSLLAGGLGFGRRKRRI
jgi:hypothetical protein